ncbi:MAG: nucleotidyltransferase domain-containing protein [Coriobacteriia bacterium]|nr:nucleotidyltransferase domain-containing protein [Coriobacteriia bacterium]
MIYDLALSFGVEAQKLHPRSYVYLFGSHAKGKARSNSDVDVAVIVERIDEPANSLDESVILTLLAEDFYPVEAHLIEAAECTSGFLGTILDTGIKLLGPAETQRTALGDEPANRLLHPA